MSAYSTAVLLDTPYVYYPDASAAPWVDDIGALDVAITGATANQPGPLSFGDTKAFSFDGVDDFGQVALDLSDTQVITVEFWLWWDSFGSGFDMALEFTEDEFSTNGGFVFDPDHSAGVVEIAHRINVGHNAKHYTRPSAAAWHHYAVVFDATQPEADEVTAYLDGAFWTPASHPNSAENTGSFVSSTLNVMCRNGASLFGDGDMAHLAVYKTALSAGRIQAHFDAASESEAPGAPLRLVQSALRLAPART